MHLKCLTIAALTTFIATPAFAQDAQKWKIDEQGLTSLSFTATQMGKEFTGQFLDFDIELAFSPDALESSYVMVEVTMESAETQDEERDEMIQNDEWFNSNNFPLAFFISENFTANPDESSDYEYLARGELTIAGEAKEIDLPFTFKNKGENGYVAGEITLNRLDYGLGQKSWPDAESISHDVHVKFDMDLLPAD
jgi:polyisoprenoid-binding protein YceI